MFQQITASIVDVWVFWLMSVSVVSALTYCGLARSRWSSAREFCSDEGGASYALPYVLTFPIYMLIVCIMIQATLILMTKIGSIYAAFAASRAAVVWRSSDPEDDDESYENARFRATRAAVIAMTPYASSSPGHQQGLIPMQIVPRVQAMALVDRIAYLQLYKRLAERNANAATGDVTSYIIRDKDGIAKDEYVLNKFDYALKATEVSFDRDPVNWNEDLSVTVTYRMPMLIPGAGRILGQSGRAFYARDIVSTVVLPAETPRSENRTLGIPYTP
jgi:Flp pilus assembly protein TadG